MLLVRRRGDGEVVGGGGEMVLLVLVLLLVLGLLCAVLSFVVHHLFLVGVVAAVGAVVLVGRAHQVTPTSVRTDLRQDLHHTSPNDALHRWAVRLTDDRLW